MPKLYPQQFFYINWSFSKQPKSHQSFLAYFYCEICCQKLSKIAQSCHTGPNAHFLLRRTEIIISYLECLPPLLAAASIDSLSPLIMQNINNSLKEWSNLTYKTYTNPNVILNYFRSLVVLLRWKTNFKQFEIVRKVSE